MAVLFDATVNVFTPDGPSSTVNPSALSVAESFGIIVPLFVGLLTSIIWTPSSLPAVTIAYVPAYVPVNVNVSTEFAFQSSSASILFTPNYCSINE